VTADLGEQERDNLVPAAVIFGVTVALVLLFELFELISRKIPEQLSQNRRNLHHGLKLLVNTAFIDGLVTFNIAVFPRFQALFIFLPDTTVAGLINSQSYQDLFTRIPSCCFTLFRP
jgi:hypothetical protein